MRSLFGSPRYEALYVVAVTCELREGELFRLMRTDVDLEVRTLRVERQLQRRRDGGGFHFPDPKHGSKCLIELPVKAADALGGHYERQAHEAKKANGLYRDAGLVFASELGTPLDASNVINRSFKPLLRRGGLPKIRFHDQRHTCATLLLMRHVHPKFVQKLLGHKSIAITLDLYSHWIPDMGDFTADAMDDYPLVGTVQSRSARRASYAPFDTHMSRSVVLFPIFRWVAVLCRLCP